MENQALSHGEIWDDSYLVQSWDDAVDEYKKYHSIAAKGENVEALLEEIQASEALQLDKEDADQQMHGTNDENNDDEEEYEPGAHTQGSPQTTYIQATKVASQQSSQSANGITRPASQTRVNAQGIPESLLSSVRDENMRNLMMSWYYAGYYTGYQEGQQKAFEAA